MGLFITAQNASQLAAGIWEFEMPPHQVRFFGECRKTEGQRSILLLANPKYEPKTKSLVFDSEGTVPLNVGSTSATLAVSSTAEVRAVASTHSTDSSSALGPGDREFLALAAELPPPCFQAAKQLLSAIRAKYPGDLKRGLQRNFSNTPDNFWYVIVQPRVGELSVTVRGEPDFFGNSKIELKIDRPGYTRFKVACPDDVTEACRLVFASRKRVS